jgi:hypothetical protein
MFDQPADAQRALARRHPGLLVGEPIRGDTQDVPLLLEIAE